MFALISVASVTAEAHSNDKKGSATEGDRCVLAQSVERPPHNREVVGSIPGRVIPKDVKRWELLLPCLAFNI